MAPNPRRRVNVPALVDLTGIRNEVLWGLKMKRLIQLGLTAATFALLATSANAAVSLNGSTAFDAALAPGQTSVVNFDSPNAAGYTFAGSTAGLIYNGADGEHVNIAAPPFGDTSLYMALQNGE